MVEWNDETNFGDLIFYFKGASNRRELMISKQVKFFEIIKSTDMKLEKAEKRTKYV